MQTQSIIVRAATLEDLKTLVRFTLEEAEAAEGRAIDAERVSMAIEAALRDPAGKAEYVLVEREGAAAGHCSVVREWSDWLAVPYLWVQSMYVAPPHRGHGLMGRLLKAVDAIALREGAPEVRIYVHRDNDRALAAWRREGFEGGPYVMASRQVQGRFPDPERP